MIHELKCWAYQFEAIVQGRKTHEVRSNDRDFRLGDYLRLKCYDPTTQVYSGDETLVRVTYISAGNTFGLPANVVVMSITKVTEFNTCQEKPQLEPSSTR